LEYLGHVGVESIFFREQTQAKRCVQGLKRLGFTVFSGDHQAGTVSFLPHGDCEEAAQKLADHGIAVRAGLHCAPLAHESAGTPETGTVRVSFGHDAASYETEQFLQTAAAFL
jgi:selenocysteine lyase/cysteine desulfurase